MKRNGRSLGAQATATAIIPRPGGDELRLMIRAMPLGHADRLVEAMPAPRPPTIRRGSHGKTEARVAYDDPGYLAEQRAWNRRMNALVILHALGADKSLELDTREDLEDPVGTADAFLEELRNTGIGDGDIAILVDQIDQLGNLGPRQLEEARDRFLSVMRGEPEEAGSSPANTPSLSAISS